MSFDYVFSRNMVKTDAFRGKFCFTVSRADEIALLIESLLILNIVARNLLDIPDLSFVKNIPMQVLILRICVSLIAALGI